MKNYNTPSKTVYCDLLGCEYDNIKEAQESNHRIELTFRKYVEEELIKTFSDGGIDNLKTTKEIWDNLEFTPKCIKNIINIME